uniref:WD_REPEATS_REGION domain-containing protein n=1 Tax=Rhabditophanes sp. KR3021 TaxID=114890 RepID=A0AC35TJM1_9BILA
MADDKKRAMEEKKRQLAEIRERKKRQEAESQIQKAERANAATNTIEEVSRRYTFDGHELQNMLNSIGMSTDTTVNLPKASLAPNMLNDLNRDHFKVPSVPTLRPSALNLEGTEASIDSFPPSSKQSYSKLTQTDDDRLQHGEFVGSLEFIDELGEHYMGQAKHQRHISCDESPSVEVQQLLTQSGFSIRHNEITKTEEVVVKEVEIKPQPEPLTEMERDQFVKKNLSSSIESTFKLFSRALAEEAYVNANYASNKMDKPNGAPGQKLTLDRVFHNEKLAKKFVCSIDYSETHNELVAVAYDSPQYMATEPGSIVNIWNLRFKVAEPEFELYSPTRLTCAAFGKFNSNIIIGGCYSGQICMWDTRDSRRTPIQKSPVSLSAHTHPINSLKIIGNQSANNIVTISTEGRMCSWSIENLTQPAETLNLMHDSKQISANSLSFFHNDMNNFAIGGEDSVLYHGSYHANKSLIAISDKWNHYGPISAVDMHRANENSKFAPLCLTGSLDWSVKLWNLKENKLVYHFDNHANYVTDVAWSPVRPGVFVSTDADGKIFLWNINESVESPVSTITLDGDVSIKKILWSKTGHHLYVGDTVGRLHIFKADETVYTPKADESERLDDYLSEAYMKCQEKVKFCPSTDKENVSTNMVLPAATK